MAENPSEVVSELVGKRLLGELLTIIEATTADKVQRDATKSLVRRDVHKCASELTVRLTVSKEEGKKATEERKVEET